MKSQLTVRVPEELNQELEKLSSRLRLKRSDLVRLALERLINEMQKETPPRPYDNVKNLIGVMSSGVDDLGEAHRKYLKRRLKSDA